MTKLTHAVSATCHDGDVVQYHCRSLAKAQELAIAILTYPRVKYVDIYNPNDTVIWSSRLEEADEMPTDFELFGGAKIT